MTDADAPRTMAPLPHRGRAWILGVALPVATTAAAWLWFLSQYSSLPEQVVTHWGPDGADGFGPRSEIILFGALLTGLTLVICCPLAVLLGRQSATRRMLIGLSAGAGFMMAGILVAITQANLTDPPGDPGALLLLVVVAALVVGVAAGAAAGDDPIVRATEPVPADAPRADLSPTQRAAWAKYTGLPMPVLIGFLVVVLGTAVLVAVVGEPLIAVVLAVALIALFLGFVYFRVTVDSRGLTARSFLGFTMLSSRADEIVRADVTEVSGLWDFGGWGLRTQVGTGVVGLVTRAGEAIRVERTGGRVQVVTVDDAATAAALLNTVAERARPVARIEDAELGSLADGTDPTSDLTTRGPGTGSRRPATGAAPRTPDSPETD